jgi:hypothetical protein
VAADCLAALASDVLCGKLEQFHHLLPC